MKISSINAMVINTNYTNRLNNKTRYQSPNLGYTPSFKGYDYKLKKELFNDIDKIPSDEITEKFAEYFYKIKDYEMENLVGELNTFWNPHRGDDFKRIVSPYIKQVLHHKNALDDTRIDLYMKELNGKSNTVEKKLEVERSFLTPLKCNIHKDNLYPNGILIYGQEENKESFINWLKNEANAVFHEIQFDINKPQESIKKISDTAQNAKETFKNLNLHSIIYVKDLDQLLSDTTSRNSILNIGRFKGLVERMANEYHSTLLMKTDKDLSKLEPAAIGDQRFNLKVNLNGGITPQEETTLQNIEKEIRRLNNKADECKSVFWDCYYKEPPDDTWLNQLYTDVY